jgi:hypothetical protein
LAPISFNSSPATGSRRLLTFMPATASTASSMVHDVNAVIDRPSISTARLSGRSRCPPHARQGELRMNFSSLRPRRPPASCCQARSRIGMTPSKSRPSRLSSNPSETGISIGSPSGGPSSTRRRRASGSSAHGVLGPTSNSLHSAVKKCLG